MELLAGTGLIITAFFLAGTVKGVIGLGLPTVALSILVAAVGLRDAVALIAIPALATNIVQAFTGPGMLPILRRLWPFLLMSCLGIFPGLALLATVEPAYLTIMFGFILTSYAAYNLLRPQLPPPGRHEGWMAPAVGSVSGLVCGLTGSFVVPGVLYLQSLGLPRDPFVKAMGVTFTSLAVVMLPGLIANGLYSVEIGLNSLLALPPAFLGMYLGVRIRRRLSETLFRKVFFVALLLLGLWFVGRSALTAGLI